MREPKPTEYQPVNGATIAFNTIVNSGLPYVRLDSGWRPDRQQDVLPKDVVVANNVFLAGKTVAPHDKRLKSPQFVAGQEGPGFTWEGNIGYGAWVGDARSASSGTRLFDPKLAPGKDKVLRPVKRSPVIGAATGAYAQVDHDIDAQPRGVKKDVGADQVSNEKAANKPLTAEDVGPSWMKPPRGPQRRLQ
jgi:hypothetical protein